MIHYLKQILKFSSILDGELSECVHVQQVVEDFSSVRQAEGKAVDLGSLSYQEQPIFQAIGPDSSLTVVPWDGSMEPQLFAMEDPSQQLLKCTSPF